MKKIKFERKLNLSKETISSLNGEQMSKVEGGWAWTLFCNSNKCPSETCTGNNVTCDPYKCPTQGCYSAAYC
jgi:hypothetical protein